jgi:hypothetical protein
MIWLSFKKWSRSSGRFFTRERLYKDGQWSPFVKVRFRHYKTLREKYLAEKGLIR